METETIDLSTATINGDPVVAKESTEEAQETTEETGQEQVEETQETEDDTTESIEQQTEEAQETEPQPEKSIDEILAELGYENKESLEGRLTKLTEYESLLGDDDYIRGLIQYRQKEGNVQPYLDAFSELPTEPLDLIRLKFDKDNTDLTREERDLLFQRELVRYNLDDANEYSNEEKKTGLALLKRDANTAKNSLESDREKFKYVDPKPAKTKEEIEAETKQKETELREQLTSKAEVKEFLNEGKVSLQLQKEGDPLIIEVENKADVVEKAMNFERVSDYFVNKDGGFNWTLWNETIAFLGNPEKFKSSIFTHGKSAAFSEVEKQTVNPTPRGGGTTKEQAIDTSNKEGFLQAALKNLGKA